MLNFTISLYTPLSAQALAYTLECTGLCISTTKDRNRSKDTVDSPEIQQQPQQQQRHHGDTNAINPPQDRGPGNTVRALAAQVHHARGSHL